MLPSGWGRSLRPRRHGWTRNLTFINRAALELNRMREQDALGRTHWEVWPWCNGTEIERVYRQAAAEKKPAHVEFCYEPLGVWLDVDAYPTGEGLAVFFRDVTELPAEIRTAEETA